MVAYCINSTVLTRVVVSFFWPGTLEAAGGSKAGKFVVWAIATTGIMAAAILIAVLVPFFSDLMNIYSSVCIFTLSFLAPPALWCLQHWGGLSGARLAADSAVMLVALVGCALGVYAAVVQIKDDWAQCDYHIEF